MKVLQSIGIVALGIVVTGCASITGGTTQEITVITNPAGASCVFEREGLPIGTIATTPGTLLVRRLKHDIMIKCDKPGFHQATYLNNSGLSGAIAGNVAADILLTAGISSIVDSASGADNEYDGSVNISLVPISATAPVSETAQAEQPR